MNRATANTIMISMKKEMHRSLENLRAPGHPKPYFISYLVRDIKTFHVWGRYGSLFHRQSDHKRVCFADVRVGSYRFDHITKGGLADNSEESESFDLTDLPLDGYEDGIRFALWRLTDARYREAVTRYHGRKSRNVSYLDENRGLPSFAKVLPSRSIQRLKKFAVDEEDWCQIVKKSSAVFRKYPEIKNSYCEFTATLVTKLYISSEGVERIWQEPIYSLCAYMWLHTKKVNQDFTIVHHTANQKELPTLKSFKNEISKKVQVLYELEKGDEMTSYNGPVLMSPKAAGLFLHEVVGHRLEGNRLLSDSEGKTFKDMVNQRIMHPDLSIIDDPSLRTYRGRSLIGHYAFDDEGTIASKAILVERGILKGFLTTRSPLKKSNHRSNGHARNQSFQRPISRMANLLIQSHSQKTWEDLKDLLIKEVKRRGLPFGIILLEVEGGETGTEAYDFQAFLGQVTVAVKVFPNGKERYVRGVDFVGTPLGSLANIIAVGSEYHIDNGYCGAESGTIPVSTVSPALLLSNLELQVKDPSKVTQYALPLPWVDG